MQYVSEKYFEKKKLLLTKELIYNILINFLI